MVTYIMCSVKTVHSVRKRTDRDPYKPEIGSFTRVLSNTITSHPLLERAFYLTILKDIKEVLHIF